MQTTSHQGSLMNTTCTRQLLAARVSLQYAGMAKKAHMKLSFWSTSGPRLVICSARDSSTSGRHSYTPPKWCVHLVHKKTLLTLSRVHSSQQSSRYIFDTTYIVTSSQRTSQFSSITLPSSSSTLAWHGFFAIPQRIYTSHIPQISWSSSLFHSCPSMASMDMPNHIVTTWSLLPIPSFV